MDVDLFNYATGKAAARWHRRFGINFCAIGRLAMGWDMYSVSICRVANPQEQFDTCFRALAVEEGEKSMPASFAHVRRAGLLWVAGVFALGSVLFAGAVQGQEHKVPQTAGVDNSKMGPYRALAQLAIAASQKGDNSNAAMLARILERTWDKAEDYGGDTALSKTNHALFEEIDKAMDQFVNLLVEHPNAAPDQAKLKLVYGTYLEKLKQAD
jgi:hypothetical protein